jgi:hypothetical protein
MQLYIGVYTGPAPFAEDAGTPVRGSVDTGSRNGYGGR